MPGTNPCATVAEMAGRGVEEIVDVLDDRLAVTEAEDEEDPTAVAELVTLGRAPF